MNWHAEGGLERGHIAWVPQDARFEYARIPYQGTYGFGAGEANERFEVIGNIYENPELLAS